MVLVTAVVVVARCEVHRVIGDAAAAAAADADPTAAGSRAVVAQAGIGTLADAIGVAVRVTATGCLACLACLATAILVAGTACIGPLSGSGPRLRFIAHVTRAARRCRIVLVAHGKGDL